MVYLTGDTHGDFHKIVDFVERIGVTKDDLIVILGDAGFNFFWRCERYRFKGVS